MKDPYVHLESSSHAPYKKTTESQFPFHVHFPFELLGQDHYTFRGYSVGLEFKVGRVTKEANRTICSGEIPM